MQKLRVIVFHLNLNGVHLNNCFKYLSDLRFKKLDKLTYKSPTNISYLKQNIFFWLLSHTFMINFFFFEKISSKSGYKQLN